MWTNTKSLTLSFIINRMLIVGLIPLAIGLYPLCNWYFGVRGFTFSIIKMVAPCYACFVPFAIILICLDRILRSAKKNRVFELKTVTNIRIVSLCCFAISIITLIAGIFIYLPFFVIGVAAAFVGLILRVLNNVFRSAVEIKSENDFTI